MIGSGSLRRDLLVALVVVAVLVWGVNGATEWIRHGTVAFREPDTLAFQTLWFFLPFALFRGLAQRRAITERARRRGLAVGYALSLAAWAALAWIVLAPQQPIGANIGLGIAMLAAPWVIFAAMHVASMG